MEQILGVFIVLLLRLGIPVAIMTLIAVAYSRYEQRHVH